jgi:lipoprotein-anchoring transpeptidase ErfK/SrfK
VSPRAVETALARLGLPTGIVNGTYDTRTRRALCAWRTATGRPADRRLPTAAEARAIVAASGLPRARSSMVTGVNVSLTCQAAFWVGANREYRRVMAASTGKPGYGTRLGIHRVFRTHRVWRYSTIYPEARMYKPMQFSGGQAMHGSATDSLVKTYPASHGCVRMLHRDIDALQAGGVGNGTLVRVFGAW